MNYTKKDIVVGFVIILILVLGYFIYSRYKSSQNIPDVGLNTQETAKKTIEEKFNISLDEKGSFITLKDVSGGNASGIATETEILVDAEDPDAGYFYQAWLAKFDDGETISLGRLQIVKGGWIITFDKNKYQDYEKVIVSQEKIFDNKIEVKVLEGTFN